jgi:hypothetical protein
LEAAPTSRCQLVELRFAIVLGLAPFGGDEALVLEAIESRVEGALLDLELVLRDLLDAQEDAVPVEWAERDCFENRRSSVPWRSSVVVPIATLLG